VRQISPDKNMHFHCATAPFTTPTSDHWASLSCASSPRGQAFYDVSRLWLPASPYLLPPCSRVRQLAVLLQASFRPLLADQPLPFTSRCCPIFSKESTDCDPPTGDFYPISSCPCRAYTSSSTGQNTRCARIFPVS